ncbi:MAG TPA: hypothetical protein GXX29_04370 [Firmicutes bacterium]|nr:hypothetical protein [Bacillota bacterium]
MTFRERYLETLLFGRPDRIPLMPGAPRESTLAAWHGQGLPPDLPYTKALCRELGLEEMPGGVRSPGISFIMIPTFEEKVLEHKDGHYIVQDWMGAITEISDRYDYTYIRSAKDFVTRKWHRFPVQNHADWEKMKERYIIDAPGRFPEGWAEKSRRIKEEGSILSIHFNGPFWQMREWCGLENLCLFFADDPAFVMEMATFWSDFITRMLERIFEQVVPDRIGISEDMAYKAHSMISPAMTRTFLSPSYKRWVTLAKAAGCPLIDMDSDGCIDELLPIWIEAGINVCHPVEVAAHNDIIAFRRAYGRKMAFTGGIDKRAIARGGAVMRAEVERVVPPLLEEGGYIPGCDHGVPPDISWPDYVAYSRLLAQYCGWL